MFFLFWWLLWPLTVPIRAFIGTGKDQYYRETVLKFWSFGIILVGSLLFLSMATDWHALLIVVAGSHLFYGFELRKVIMSEQGVDLFR